MRRIVLATAAIAALALAACAKQEPPAAPTLRYTMKERQRSWSTNPADTTKEVWVAFHYPQFIEVPGDPAARDSLDHWVQHILIQTQPGDSVDLEGFAAELISQYQEMRLDHGGPMIAWFYENEVQVTWDSLDVVSMLSTADMYTGGAHGTWRKEWCVFDVRSGRRLALGDLIGAAARDTLLAMGERAFRRAHDIPDELSVSEAGYLFPDDRFMLPANFGIDGNGLVFHFNEGEVAGHADGPTTIAIAWDEIAGYIRPDGPLKSLRPGN